MEIENTIEEVPTKTMVITMTQVEAKKFYMALYAVLVGAVNNEQRDYLFKISENMRKVDEQRAQEVWGFGRTKPITTKTLYECKVCGRMYPCELETCDICGRTELKEVMREV